MSHTINKQILICQSFDQMIDKAHKEKLDVQNTNTW